MTFANITREPADDWIGSGIAETVSSELQEHSRLDAHRPRARLRRTPEPLRRARISTSRSRLTSAGGWGATWVVVGGFQRLGELVRITANFVDVGTGQVRRTVKVDGRIGDIFALQDKIVFELSQGLNLACAAPRSPTSKSARRARSGVQKLRARDDEPATRVARLDRAGNLGVRGSDSPGSEYAIAWAALGGAYRSRGRSSRSAISSARA